MILPLHRVSEKTIHFTGTNAAESLPPADLPLWLAPHERAQLEHEARFIGCLEAMAAYRELSGTS